MLLTAPDVETLEPLVHALAEALTRRGWRMATAESCTGGLISACLTSMPGSSAWFERGYVTYSNAAKTESLGIDPALLLAHGAVSEPVAAAMALGAGRAAGADVALSVTGIAGPGGGSVSKPVGLVCLGWWCADGRQRVDTLQFSGDRRQIRAAATEHALRGMLQHLIADGRSASG